LQVAQQTGQAVPVAVLNNLGILELETNHLGQALVYFYQCLSLELGQSATPTLTNPNNIDDTRTINELIIAVEKLFLQLQQQQQQQNQFAINEMRSEGQMRMYGGKNNIVEVLRENIDRAKLKLQSISLLTKTV
jgi:hypothetical protein